MAADVSSRVHVVWAAILGRPVVRSTAACVPGEKRLVGRTSRLGTLAVHPLSIGAPPQPRTRLLGLGTPAAPDEHSLLLLPSGPDRVRRSSPRRTRPSTLRCPLSGGERTTSNGTSTPLERVSGYNGPLLRRLARPTQC